jgi:hypothetical protein
MLDLILQTFRQERLVADDKVRVGCPGPVRGLQPLLEITRSLRLAQRSMSITHKL